jgi:hypothetical protein
MIYYVGVQSLCYVILMMMICEGITLHTCAMYHVFVELRMYACMHTYIHCMHTYLSLHTVASYCRATVPYLINVEKKKAWVSLAVDFAVIN